MTAPRRLGVTDHALCCWLQRTGAMDIEVLRALLAASLERAAAAAACMDAARFNILVDGMVFIVQHGAVVTVLDDDGRGEARLRRSPGGAQG